ncbi:protein of unknown function [Paracoccus halophilus]|uniref:Glutamyl-tRNA synthetase n=1 Tax=Paracoccus halophilus TaxID=376733 RepID=A0A099F5N8_9RHOB|nr:DUF4202 domain-containing protein [Paracoccus halophilus]KGJ05583.1 glutamyl-tRNA synthetase [Paracoccus halophilus]SFA47167.1 protein of unknown function [Paracoccus halophilus]
MTRLQTAFDAIDKANAADPNRTDGQPDELLYGQRMTAEQEALYPGAAEPLRIACRGQHIERWKLPRKDFPMDRPGYLKWRTEQGRRHAARVAEIMRDAGYPDSDIEHAEKMLTKQGIKRDEDVQALEDVACFTFIRWYMGPFSQTRDAQEMQRIVERTARKMSAMARARALTEFTIPEPFSASFRD